MLQDPASLLGRWVEANQAVAQAESEVAARALAALSVQAPGPDAQERERAKELRKSANELFAVAMASLNQATDARSIRAVAPDSASPNPLPPQSDRAKTASQSGQDRLGPL